jgi:predicted PurR-regulated permease PerM
MAEKKIRELKHTARRVFLDPSSPSLSSIVRTTVIVLLIISFWGFIQGTFLLLTKLFVLLILAIFFAYLLDPLVRLIRTPFKNRHLERFMPRSLAIVIAYLLVFVGLGVSISYLAPRIGDQAKQLATNIPAYTNSFQTWAKGINNRFERYKIPDEIQDEINKKVTTYLGDFGETLTSFLGELLLSAATYLPWLVLLPVLSFFFLKDVNLFRISILRLFPTGVWRLRAESFLEDVNKTLAAYTRAQLISCFLIGSICTLGFILLDVNYALLLGVMAGFLEFVPLIGPLIVALTAITISAFYSPWQALYVGIFLLILRICQDYIFYPRIVRGGIHLHPLAIILSVLAGEQIAGIMGVFLSIPVVALITVLFKHIREHRGSKGLVADLLVDSEKEKLIETTQT